MARGGGQTESSGLVSHVKVGSRRLSIRNDHVRRLGGMHESYRGHTLADFTHRPLLLWRSVIMVLRLNHPKKQFLLASFP